MRRHPELERDGDIEYPPLPTSSYLIKINSRDFPPLVVRTCTFPFFSFMRLRPSVRLSWIDFGRVDDLTP